ncbi:MAG: beta-eliminating lyase-related protein [Pseudomonadota bacterium]
MIFTSDNASGAHPAVLAALAAANEGYTMPYGADDGTGRVEALLREIFEAPEARVFLVATGTAANGLALATLAQPWSSIWCHRIAHIEADECNAPEFFSGGAKLSLLDGPGAKLDAAELDAALAAAGAGGVHHAQPGALSLTQATEQGAVYTVTEIEALAETAHARGLRVHMDGTRFANALAASNATPAAMSHRAGVDILCLGATKCGALGAEAVILFDPALAWEFELRRKRGGHLFSKMRFLSAQMEAWLAAGLWLRLAAQANAMGARLAEGLRARGVPIVSPAEANLLFVHFTAAQHAALQAAGARYYADPLQDPGTLGTPGALGAGAVSARLVASYATQAQDVDRFLDALPVSAPLPNAPGLQASASVAP